MRTTSPELFLPLDRSRPRALAAQVEDGLREAVRTGRLPAGTRLPSTRALAADLGVTRGVVVAAYDQLVAEGYLSSRAGSGTIVSATAAPEPSGRSAPERDASVVVDFRTGLPDLALFPRAVVASATRAALQSLPDAELGYTDPRGLPRLREAVADYLGRVRGVTASADEVVITNGFGHGVIVLGRALQELGHRSVAVEDPGHDGPRETLQWLGLRTRPVPVDDDGLVVEQLARSRARAVVVTPAHQYPTGAVLAASRRTALVEWARHVDGFVIEDDYDAEYRFDGNPVGALQGVAPDRVIYCGTLSKTLAPGMRIGWMVLPRGLVDRVASTRRIIDHCTAPLVQATATELLLRGDIDRHLRRTRRVYRARRDALVESIARWLPGATVDGIAAGLHVYVRLPAGADEAVVAERALAKGVRVYPGATFWSGSSSGPALVLGYGTLQPDVADRGLQLVAEGLAC
jgi:GntR family transcriptional regulator / MocR family aminotransferase